MLLENNRFTLTKLTPEYWEILLSLYNDSPTMKYIPNNPSSWTQKELEQKFQTNEDNYKIGIGVYAVIDKLTGSFIGQAGIYNSFNSFTELEIGYILSRDFWNKGYGTEICTELIKYCFEQLEAKSVMTRMYTANKASAQVSKKSGMRFLEEVELENMLYRSSYIIER